jgi:SAM-dependent methyltransferase
VSELKRREKLWQDRHGQRLMAESYAAPGPRRVYDRQIERVLDSLQLAEGAGVLEVGCGGGQLLQALAARRPDLRLVGLDLSAAGAGPCAPTVARLVGDGEQLPFRDQTFDAVVFNGALHHLPSPARGLAEAARVSRTGAQLVLYEPISTRFSRTVHHLLDPLVQASTEYESPVDVALKDAFTLPALRAALAAAGYAGAESWHEPFAYPLTGCYAGGPLGQHPAPFELLLAVEERLLGVPVLGKLLVPLCWRLLVSARSAG